MFRGGERGAILFFKDPIFKEGVRLSPLKGSYPTS